MNIIKRSRTRYLVLRNWLNFFFILFAVAFVVCYFKFDTPFANPYCVACGIIAVLLKMGESVIRVVENMQQNKQHERYTKEHGSE